MDITIPSTFRGSSCLIDRTGTFNVWLFADKASVEFHFHVYFTSPPIIPPFVPTSNIIDSTSPVAITLPLIDLWWRFIQVIYRAYYLILCPVILMQRTDSSVGTVWWKLIGRIHNLNQHYQHGLGCSKGLFQVQGLKSWLFNSKLFSTSFKQTSLPSSASEFLAWK